MVVKIGNMVDHFVKNIMNTKEEEVYLTNRICGGSRRSGNIVS
jgi:hypothetical protein